MDAQEREAASARATEEYGAMRRAVERLEAELASPSPGREEAWRARTAEALRAVAEGFRNHCASAESPDGILRHVESVAGHSRDVTLAHEEHEHLLQHADTLLKALERGGDGVTPIEVRRLATELTALYRQHEGRIADLIYATLEMDTGVGD